MEKSVAVTSQKVSNLLPDDIIFPILSKLPLKSLKRFGCVRKLWGLLFENPHFMNIYRNHFESRNLYYDGKPLLIEQITWLPGIGMPMDLLSKDKYEMHLLSGDKFENRVELNLPLPLQDPDLQSIIILGSGSINGTFCFSTQFNKNRAGERRVVLWNPTTEEFKVIPCSPLESIPNGKTHIRFHGFGYDNLRDDYKVIRSVDYYEVTFDDIEFIDYSAKDLPWDPFWEVYSLRTNSWRKLNVDTVTSSGSYAALVQLYMDGMCHWWHQIDPYTNEEEHLVSFDLHNEVFFTTPMPLDLDDNYDFKQGWRHLVVLNESIALISYNGGKRYLHISILGEIGVKESWTKLFVVGFGFFSGVQEPIGAVKNGRILFRKWGGELVLFDVSTQTIEEIGAKVQLFCQMKIYKESSLPIAGLNI